MDTIIALSSGSLPSGVAIIRCSGRSSQDIIQMFCGEVPLPRTASLRKLRDSNDQLIDQGLVIWFKTPNSFTGEDCAEFHVHGGKAVVDKILYEATSIKDVRLAEAGEFARRAFSNGKIDLTEAEGLADLIDAETEAQRKIAIHLSSGGLKELYNDWQDQFLNARALIEADIDFADEDDVPGSVADKVWSEIEVLQKQIQQHLNSYSASEKIRDGFRISLIGRPNVGKSSLLNALAGSNRAIVSEEAGTTRDVVEVRMDLGGYLVLLSDTAGIRDDAGAVEAEGIRRSIMAAQSSDLILHLDDKNDFEELEGVPSHDIIRLSTKADENSSSTDLDSALSISVHEPSTIKQLVERLNEEIATRMGTNLHRDSIKSRYLDHIKCCLQEIELALIDYKELELRAEHLRRAAYSLGRITGQHDTEDVLGRIFSSFCIGK